MAKISWQIRQLSVPTFSERIALVTLVHSVHTASMQERLQKILSARGICSRRKAEEYIEQGLVMVNGTVAKLGQKADAEKDKIKVDGAVLSDREEMLYVVMNKPVGVVTTNTAERKEKSVRDLLPKKFQGKIYPVGRLDKDTSGLLLFTNDGVLAYRLTHPKFDHEKEYEVVTEVPVTDGQLRKLQKGVTLSGVKSKEATVKRMGNEKFSIALTEGKNRQIRRMCQKVGAPVKELRRFRITTFTDPRLKKGEVRVLTNKERNDILQSVDL